MHTPILYRVYYLKFQYNRIILYKTFDYIEIRLTYEVQGSMLRRLRSAYQAIFQFLPLPVPAPPDKLSALD